MKKIIIGIHENDIVDVSDASVLSSAENDFAMMIGGFAQANGISGFIYGSLRNAELARKVILKTLKEVEYEHEFYEKLRSVNLATLLSKED